jgi:hypothetical protein
MGSYRTRALGVAFIALALLAGAARAQDTGRQVSPEEPLETSSPIGTDGDTIRIPSDKFELHRLRIVNRDDGAIQVSTDAGATWQTIGRVVAPARTCAEGYIAAEYAKAGTVAAIAVHGLRIRTGANDPTLHAPLVLAIEPAQYTVSKDASVLPNKGFGGYISGAAGIYTDIPAGTSLFRELAPLVGDPVYLESGNGRLFPLPHSFQPTGHGETLVIPVLAPKNSLLSVTIENKAGGAVEATFADGTTKQITGVVQPVQGSGRFDGTAYTGVGRINTAHTGVITVSTVPIDGTLPEGEGRERRGGFQISPAWHNARTAEAGSPVILTIGPPGPRRRDLEGMPPLFRDAIGLDDAKAAHVEVSVDDGPWEPMPTIIGARPDAFTGPGLTGIWRSEGIHRTAVKGVTSFRLLLPQRSPSRSQITAARAADSYRALRYAAARAGKIPIVKGILTVNANPTNAANVAFVRLSIEGRPRGFTNIAPFALSWDTTLVADGEYLLQADAMDSAGIVLASSYKRVYVLNQPTRSAADATPRSGTAR